MALLSFQRITVSFGGPPVLEDVNLDVHRGDRIALVGRNGEGKSTLLRVLTGEQAADAGEIVQHQSVRIGHLPQEVPHDLTGTVGEIAGEGARHLEEWEQEHRAEQACTQLGLDPTAPFETLSGGQKRRTLLARALLTEPDVLILDEPTNHLDLGAIEWLEQYLSRFPGAVLFVTHDRALQRRVATAIAELDRGQLTRWDATWDQYLRRREEAMATEDKHRALFDKKLAEEEVWIRQGIKARRTRNEGRVRALEKLREARRDRRERAGPVKLQVQEAAKSGRKVIEAQGLTHAWDDGSPVIRDLDLQLMRGDKVGIIGPNGCGKSTLLNILLGRLTPTAGSVEHGTRLEIAWFDQHRAQLDPEKSVAENVAGDHDFVTVNGSRRHVIGYLADFLFSSDRARTPVKVLSGGERNRVMLARLFLQPANVLILDEPTNDLDTDTLELLEEQLMQFDGTLLLVSHDRELLNRVVTSTLVFEGEGRVTEYVGGYDDWLDQRPTQTASAGKSPTTTKPAAAAPPRPKKLNNREREELASLPGSIEQMEAELAELTETLANPGFYRQPADEVQATTQRATELPDRIAEAYARWEALAERA